MNLGIEYFVRSNFKDLALFFPCSLFLTSEEGEKIVKTIDKGNSGYIIKHWDLFGCERNLALPPMEEIVVDNVFDKKAHLLDCKILKLQEQPIPTSLNNWRSPMPKKDYDSYCENILYPFKHENAKEFWLWREFVKIYKPSYKFPKLESYNWLGVKLRRSEIYASQIESLKSNHPKLWKYWNIWKKNLIKRSSIAGELIFYRIYN